jgi:uncharacterized membrane protein
MLKKISDVLIMSGKYLMIIGVILIIVGWLFPYKTDAMTISPTSIVVGDMSPPDFIATCENVDNIVYQDFGYGNGWQGGGTCAEFIVDFNFETFVDYPEWYKYDIRVFECDFNDINCINIPEFTLIEDIRLYTGYINEVTFTYLNTPAPTSGSLFHFTSPTTGEISNNPSDLMANVGTVSTDVFSSSLPYMLVFIGVPLAFYVIQSLKKTVVPKETKKDRIIRDKDGKQIGIDVSGDGYKRIINKKGQEIGVAKE